MNIKNMMFELTKVNTYMRDMNFTEPINSNTESPLRLN